MTFMITEQEKQIFADLRRCGLRHPGMVPKRFVEAAKRVAEFETLPKAQQEDPNYWPVKFDQIQKARELWKKIGLGKLARATPTPADVTTKARSDEGPSGEGVQ